MDGQTTPTPTATVPTPPPSFAQPATISSVLSSSGAIPTPTTTTYPLAPQVATQSTQPLSQPPLSQSKLMGGLPQSSLGGPMFQSPAGLQGSAASMLHPAHHQGQPGMGSQPVQANLVGINPANYEAEKRITIWNKLERRKISGNAAPMGKNLVSYLAKHPECEVFTGQDKEDPIAMSFGPNLTGPFSMYGNDESLLQQASMMQQVERLNQQQQAVADAAAGTTIQVQNTMGITTSQPMALGGPASGLSSAMMGTQQTGLHYMASGKLGPFGHQDQAEKRITIWHKKEKRKISGNAAPMEKNLRSYLATHPECEVYTCQDKGEGDYTASVPVTIPDGDDDEEPFEEAHLTPVQSFDFESNLENKGIPITSPGFRAHNNQSMALSPMSPVESLATSFNTMDISFSMGSQSNSFQERMMRHGRSPRFMGMHGGTPGFIDLDSGRGGSGGRRLSVLSTEHEIDSPSEEGRGRSSTIDDFGVMGKLEGI